MVASDGVASTSFGSYHRELLQCNPFLSPDSPFDIITITSMFGVIRAEFCVSLVVDDPLEDAR
jgi:hypothetical protein